jgi:hypothetical protein
MNSSVEGKSIHLSVQASAWVGDPGNSGGRQLAIYTAEERLQLTLPDAENGQEAINLVVYLTQHR